MTNFHDIFHHMGKTVLDLFGLSTLEREPTEQAKVDEETSHMALYQSSGCVYCSKVSRILKRYNLHIPMLNPYKDDAHFHELVDEGGKDQVPALRISHEDGSKEWIYESDDIIRYLTRRFSH